MPHPAEAEREVVSALLVKADAWREAAEIVTGGDFYEARLGNLFHAAVTVGRRDGVTDPVTIWTECEALFGAGSVGPLEGMAEFAVRRGVAVNVTHYAKLVKDAAYRRAKIQAAKDVIRDASDMGADTAPAIARLQETERAAEEFRNPRPVFQVLTLAEAGVDIRDQPPPLPVLFDREGQSDEGRTVHLPFMVRGKAHLLVGPGGTGKSKLLTQFAISVATGEPWLGTYRSTDCGKIFLGFGEEDMDEIKRRLFAAQRSLQLTPDLIDMANAHIAVQGFAGTRISLLERGPNGNIESSRWYNELFEALEKTGPWRAIVLDPLSRWGGPDVEKDSDAATNGVVAFESFCKLPGNPAVFVAHHTRKRSGTAGNNDDDADDARGSSGLTAGFRWQVNMRSLKPQARTPRGVGIVKLIITKSNYTPSAPALYLARDTSGVLRPATIHEWDPDA